MKRTSRYFLLIMIFTFALSISKNAVLAATGGHINHPPTAVEVKTALTNALVTWNHELPDSFITFNSGVPGAMWRVPPGMAPGVEIDLSAFKNITLEQLDFCHGFVGDAKMPGPYYYNIHILDMGSQTVVAIIDSLIAGDSSEQPRWEAAVSLGSVPAPDTVGIYIEGLTVNTYQNNDYAFPSVVSDTSAYVMGVNKWCANISDPFNAGDPNYTNIYHSYEYGGYPPEQTTNWVIDLWIDHQEQGLMKLAHDADIAAVNSISEGFKVYRGQNKDNMTVLAKVGSDQMNYLDETAEADSSYFYAVSSFSDSLESARIFTEYIHPAVLNIATAKADTNSDFVPDLLDEYVSLTGVIASVNYSANTQYYMQDPCAGILLYHGGFNLNLDVGDSVFVRGKLTQYKGLSRIEPDSAGSVAILGKDNSIDTLKLQLADIGEPYESMLAAFENVQILNPNEWPTEGNNGSLIKVSDGVDTVDLYIDRETDIDGWTPPTGNIRLVAIIDQYTNASPPDDGYDLRPRFQSDFITLTSLEENNGFQANTFALGQNYPNPFNPRTVIHYTLPAAEQVELTVYNTLGQKIATLVSERQAAGKHKVEWDGSEFASGIYFYMIEAGAFRQVRKMMLIK